MLKLESILKSFSNFNIAFVKAILKLFQTINTEHDGQIVYQYQHQMNFKFEHMNLKIIRCRFEKKLVEMYTNSFCNRK